MISIMLPRQGLEAIVAHADFCYPEECCGLLAGETEGRVRFVYPLTNAAASPSSYTIEPREHFEAWRHAERHGWELLGAFHSHPHGPHQPSHTDRKLATEPDWVYLIVSARRVHAYRIADQIVTPVKLIFTN